MQMSQRQAPESRNAAQERNDQLKSLNSATEGLRTGGVQRAEAGLSGSQLNTRINNMSQQPKTAADLMKDPNGRMAVNNALQQLGADSFQNRTDWMQGNPALAKQVFEMAKNSVPQMGGGFNSGSRVNVGPHGARINAQQSNAYAHGQGASNSTGQIGG